MSDERPYKIGYKEEKVNLVPETLESAVQVGKHRDELT